MTEAPDNSIARPESTGDTQTPTTREPLTGWAAVYDFVVQSYCWLAIFFILYVLSLGPMYSTWRKSVEMGKSPVLQAIYLPLAGLCDRSETLNTVVEWYVGLWQS